MVIIILGTHVEVMTAANCKIRCTGGSLLADSGGICDVDV